LAFIIRRSAFEDTKPTANTQKPQKIVRTRTDEKTSGKAENKGEPLG
jgi:hypothetical protein